MNATLEERLRREAEAEAKCPECGRRRDYRQVWRHVEPGRIRGTLEHVCAEHGPHDEPGAVPRAVRWAGRE